MSGFEKQTYTQVPNSLFKIMGEMDECELKVILYICRYTFGYHRDEIKISTRKLARAIGMSVASVDKGASAAVERGLIERITDGQNTTLWRAVVSDSNSDTPDEVIQNLEHPDSENESQVGVKENNKDNTEGVKDDAAVFQALEKLMGSLNTSVPRYVDTWLEKHTLEWILKAIDEANARGARSEKYVDKVLIGWEANGYPKSRDEQVRAARSNGNGSKSTTPVPRGVTVAEAWLARKEAERAANGN